MSIVIDYNQVGISSLMAQIGSNPKEEVNANLIRHITLSNILSYKKKFGEEYGELVFACDSKKYWRRDYFPYYKATRKKRREASGFDWNVIFETLNQIREELKEYFPYRVIQVEGAEADDVIAILAKEHAARNEPLMIISGDKDFMQLQKYPGIRQYSPVMKKLLITDDPAMFLKEHIMRGDDGDGVPNFLSEDATFVTDGLRQKPLLQKKLDSWLALPPEVFCDDVMLRNYKRNEKLIDLSFIPEELEQKILENYSSQNKAPNYSVLTNYFMENSLRNLYESLYDF